MDRPALSTTLRVLTDALSQGVIVLDGDGCVVHANAAARRRFRARDRLAAGRPIRPWLTTAVGLSPCAVDRLDAGETIAVARGEDPDALRVSRVILPSEDGTPWTALVVEDRRGDARVAPASRGRPAIAESHGALWSSLVDAVERAYDEAVALAVFTVELALPVEAGAVCRVLCDPAEAGDVVGFVDATSDPGVLDPASVCAVLVSAACIGTVAAERRRALADAISERGWTGRVGVAVLRLDTDVGGAWDADERARTLVRRSIRVARTVGRDERRPVEMRVERAFDRRAA